MTYNDLRSADGFQEKSPGCGICEGPLTSLFPFGESPKVVRCQTCRTESIRPLPTPGQLEAHYANYPITKTSEEQILFLTTLAVETLKYYMKRMNLRDASSEPVRLLEIGFGNGAGLFAGSRMGLQSYGVDLDPASVSSATAFSQKHSMPVSCLCGDVTTLRSLAINFDIVKASQILEHVINPVEFLSEIARAQPAGGYLIIETPNNEAAFWSIKNRMRKRFNRLNYYNSLKLQEHLWGYTKKSLPLLLQKAGYRVVFFRDHAVGNPIFEPQSVLWYPTFRAGLREAIKARSLQPLLYPSVRVIDSVSSRLFHAGTGFAVLCQKVAS